MSIERVDLGVCPAYDYGGEGPTAIVLPGRMLAGMPAVWFAFEPLLRHGWRVILLWWEYLDTSQSPWEFVRERADAAIAHAGGADLLVGKSLGTFGAPIDLPAVWLTPLLREPEVVEALRARVAPSLFIGGTNDPAWDGTVARELGDAVELEGADHGLARLEDAPRVVDAVTAFSGRLGLRA
ncbi:MAG: alpha/beta fold hydrolase [Gaiellaceae bacterium]